MDWRVRFAAVEKITLILRFLEDKPVKKCPAVRSVLSHAFCCMIASMEDINVHISQRAILHLGTIHDSAIRTMLWSLEHQFDTMPIDRPVILKRLYQVFNCLLERKILTWQFFSGRFETLISELQADKHDFAGTAGRTSSAAAAATTKKGTVASSAVAAADAAVAPFTSLRTRLSRCSGDSTAPAKSLAASLKYPYKRTISAPVGMGLSKLSKANMLSHQNSSVSTHQVNAVIVRDTDRTCIKIRGGGAI